MPQRHWPSEREERKPTGSAMFWCVALGTLFVVFLGVEILTSKPHPQDISNFPAGLRFLRDLCFYFSAGGFGIAVAHLLIKKSTAMTNARLRDVVYKSLNELEKMLPPELQEKEDQETEHQEIEAEIEANDIKVRIGPKESPSAKSAPRIGPIPLPIPYLVAKLADMRPDNFGYFGGKLLARDPRLLLNLSLDVSLQDEQSDALWEMKQRILGANREIAKSAASSEEVKSEAKTTKQEPAASPSAAGEPAGIIPSEARTRDHAVTDAIDVLLRTIGLLRRLLEILKKPEDKV